MNILYKLKYETNVYITCICIYCTLFYVYIICIYILQIKLALYILSYSWHNKFTSSGLASMFRSRHCRTHRRGLGPSHYEILLWSLELLSVGHIVWLFPSTIESLIKVKRKSINIYIYMCVCVFVLVTWLLIYIWATKEIMNIFI